MAESSLTIPESSNILLAYEKLISESLEHGESGQNNRCGYYIEMKEVLTRSCFTACTNISLDTFPLQTLLTDLNLNGRIGESALELLSVLFLRADFRDNPALYSALLLKANSLPDLKSEAKLSVAKKIFTMFASTTIQRVRKHSQISNIVSTAVHILSIQNPAIKCQNTTTTALKTLENFWKCYENNIDDGHLKDVLLVLLRYLVYKNNTIRMHTLDLMRKISQPRMRSLFTYEDLEKFGVDRRFAIRQLDDGSNIAREVWLFIFEVFGRNLHGTTLLKNLLEAYQSSIKNQLSKRSPEPVFFIKLLKDWQVVILNFNTDQEFFLRDENLTTLINQIISLPISNGGTLTAVISLFQSLLSELGPNLAEKFAICTLPFTQHIFAALDSPPSELLVAFRVLLLRSIIDEKNVLAGNKDLGVSLDRRHEMMTDQSFAANYRLLFTWTVSVLEEKSPSLSAPFYELLCSFFNRSLAIPQNFSSGDFEALLFQVIKSAQLRSSILDFLMSRPSTYELLITTLFKWLWVLQEGDEAAIGTGLEFYLVGGDYEQLCLDLLHGAVEYGLGGAVIDFRHTFERALSGIPNGPTKEKIEAILADATNGGRRFGGGRGGVRGRGSRGGDRRGRGNGVGPSFQGSGPRPTPY